MHIYLSVPQRQMRLSIRFLLTVEKKHSLPPMHHILTFKRLFSSKWKGSFPVSEVCNKPELIEKQS
jgi:hypothetical protein